MMVYDPILRSGRKLSETMGWNHDADFQKAIDFFRDVSDGRVNFSIVGKVSLNKWPVKEDGFSYDEDSYMAVMQGSTLQHEPDIMDYYQFLNDPNLDLCPKFNRGEFDELWVTAGPWFGFYETALASSPAGPVGFWYNGPTYKNASCNKLMPVGIPGPHTFGHRAEATMAKVYGGWEENRMAHNWDKFALNRAQSPDFREFGCGSIHYAPNSMYAADDYDFDRPYQTMSYCDDFYNYPSLEPAGQTAKQIICAAWGCTTDGYERWWWGHLPHFAGTGPDGILNDWWQYIFDPNLASGVHAASGPTVTPSPTIIPSAVCPPSCKEEKGPSYTGPDRLKNTDCGQTDCGADADCNGIIEENDFGIFIYQYIRQAAVLPRQRTANFNCRTDAASSLPVDQADFQIWRNNYLKNFLSFFSERFAHRIK